MGLIAKVLSVLLSKAALVAALVLLGAFLYVGHDLIVEKTEAYQEELTQVETDLESNQQKQDKNSQGQDAANKDLDRLDGELKKSRTAIEQKASRAVSDKSKQVERQIDALNRNIGTKAAEIRRLDQKLRDDCGWRRKLLDAVLRKDTCEALRNTLRQAKELRQAFQKKLDNAEDVEEILSDPNLTESEKLKKLNVDVDWSEVDAIEDQRTVTNDELNSLKRKHNKLESEEIELEKTLNRTQDTGVGWLVNHFKRVPWLWLLGAVLLVLLTPRVLRTVCYFLLMPLVSRVQRPLQLSDQHAHAAATLKISPAERTLPVRLSAGDVLSARSEDVRPVQGEKPRSQLLYDWKAPFISYATGLHSLSRITGDEEGTETTLAVSDDPNAYLMRIDFTNHPGVVMRPTHVVGVMGSPTLVTRWRWSIQSLATWQVRYILFAGTGSLIIKGVGDVVATSAGDRATKIEQQLMMGFDSRLTARVNRTEVFWPYLRGTTSLIDDEFAGPYLLFWQKSNTAGPSNPAVKAFNAVFSAIGKFLGF